MHNISSIRIVEARKPVLAWGVFDWRDVLAVCLMLAISVLFKSLFEASLPFYVNPPIIESVKAIWAKSPFAFIRPLELEPGRFHWVPSSLLPFYLLTHWLSTFQIYLVLSSGAAVTAYVASRLADRTRVFATTLALTVLFGTQLNYASTLGLTLLHYIVVSYIFINILFVYRYFKFRTRANLLGFLLSLVALALSTELWINYVIGLILSSIYLFYWSGIHGSKRLKGDSLKIGSLALVLLLVYLPMRMSVARQYLGPGAEEELILTYDSVVLMVEDFITNFLTLLYMALSNFLPSALTSSNSLTFLGPERIIAGQNGYHPQFQHLVVMNHIFFWRYLAGASAAAFLAAGWISFQRSRTMTSMFHPVVVCGFLFVVTGFCTYLLIKFRPYNSAPALHYKAIISICAVSLLISFILEYARTKFASRRIYFAVVGLVWAIIVVGAITRPGMIKVQLQNVGLVGYSDPMTVLRDKFNFGAKVAN